MTRAASSRTVSTSTEPSVSAAMTASGGSGDGSHGTGDGSGGGDPTGREGGAESGEVARSRPVGRLGAAWSALCAPVSRFAASPGWRRVKKSADGVMLVAVAGALGWTLCNSVFLGTRAVSNRNVAVVHLGGQPEVQITWANGDVPGYPVLPGEVLTGRQTAHVSISVANDGPDGVVVRPGTLTGPYLTGAVQLRPDNGTGYILGNGTIHFVGTVTVDCDAAADVARALAFGGRAPRQLPTAIAFDLRDTNKAAHHAYLVVDTTAAAIQGRVCTR